MNIHSSISLQFNLKLTWAFDLYRDETGRAARSAHGLGFDRRRALASRATAEADRCAVRDIEAVRKAQT
jgi:hypothetical protein